MPKIYGADCYTKAKAFGKKAAGNSAPKGDGGVDPDVQESLASHGICSGQTTTWVIGLMGTQEGASDTKKFTDYSLNVLRFQGAYMKDFGGRIEEQLAEVLKKGLDPECKALPSSAGKDIKALKFPDKGDWGAYLAVWGHATGVGSKGGKWYIFDPNTGLHEYDKKDAWMADIGGYIDARKNMPPPHRVARTKDIMLFPYTKK